MTCILCDCRSCKSSKLCCWKIPQRIWQRLVRMTKPASSSTLQRPMIGNCRDWAVVRWRIKMPGRSLLLQQACSISGVITHRLKRRCAQTHRPKSTSDMQTQRLQSTSATSCCLHAAGNHSHCLLYVSTPCLQILNPIVRTLLTTKQPGTCCSARQGSEFVRMKKFFLHMPVKYAWTQRGSHVSISVSVSSSRLLLAFP